MPPLASFDAVLFDLDGLVLDTEPTYLHAWRLTAADYGVNLNETIGQTLAGRHRDDVLGILAELIGPRFEPVRFCALAENHWRAHVQSHGIACMPGLHELLDRMEALAIPHALATNSEARYAQECLNRAGVGARFPIRVSRDQVPRGKPDPDVFLEAARRLQTPPHRCLVLEDSHTGLEAARRAGAIPVLVQAGPVATATRNLAAACYSSLYEIFLALNELTRRAGP